MSEASRPSVFADLAAAIRAAPTRPRHDCVALRKQTHDNKTDDAESELPFPLRETTMVILPVVALGTAYWVFGFVGVAVWSAICGAVGMVLDNENLRRAFARRVKSRPVIACLEATGVVLLLFAFGGIFILMWVAGRFRKHRTEQRNRKWPPDDVEDSPFESRITCYGMPQQLHRAASIRDTPFEPVIVQASRQFAVGDTTKMMAELGFMAATVAAAYLIGRGLKHALPLPWASWYASTLDHPLIWPLALTPVAGLMLRNAFPTYYRVVPGHLEIVNYNFGGTHPVRIKTIPLRLAKVTVRHHELNISVRHLPAGVVHMITLRDMREPNRLAEAIMRGAISTAEAQRVPAENLLGDR
jgi:hypothetical protein